MLTRIYKFPIMGKVLNDRPLTADKDYPLCAAPLDELPGYNDLEPNDKGFLCTNLKYDIDEGWCALEVTASEALHEWLLNLLPRLKGIMRRKGWKLDKGELVKVRMARGEK